MHELQTLQCEQRGGRYIRQVVHHFIRIVIPLISTFLNRGAARPFSAFISSSEAAKQLKDNCFNPNLNLHSLNPKFKLQTVVFCLIMYWFHTSTKYYIVYDIKNKACYTKKSQRPITATTPWAIKKRATLFLIITPAFLGRFLYFLYQ